MEKSEFSGNNSTDYSCTNINVTITSQFVMHTEHHTIKGKFCAIKQV